MDLRERVVAAVEDGMSRRQASVQFGVAISTSINWVRRFRETGSVAPGQMGGHKPKSIAGGHRTWLIARCKEKDFTLRELVAELADERGLKVDYRSVWNFVHEEKLTYKKKRFWPVSKTGPMLRAGGRSGKNIKAGLIHPVWFSLMRHGQRPIWRRCEAGRHGAKGSRQKFRRANGKP